MISNWSSVRGVKQEEFFLLSFQLLSAFLFFKHSVFFSALVYLPRPFFPPTSALLYMCFFPLPGVLLTITLPFPGLSLNSYLFYKNLLKMLFSQGAHSSPPHPLTKSGFPCYILSCHSVLLHSTYHI